MQNEIVFSLLFHNVASALQLFPKRYLSSQINISNPFFPRAYYINGFKVVFVFTD